MTRDDSKHQAYFRRRNHTTISSRISSGSLLFHILVGDDHLTTKETIPRVNADDIVPFFTTKCVQLLWTKYHSKLNFENVLKFSEKLAIPTIKLKEPNILWTHFFVSQFSHFLLFLLSRTNPYMADVYCRPTGWLYSPVLMRNSS